MALNPRNRIPSSAPLFIANPGILDEDNPAASDGISPHPGANSWLGASAAKHNGQQRLAPDANKVSESSLRSMSTRNRTAKPTPGRPDGAPYSDGSW
jgi:hypothetical protein